MIASIDKGWLSYLVSLFLAIQSRFLGPIRVTPIIRQMEATECGSVCLSMILSYYGHNLSPDEAREACGVSRDGSKASYILRAARTYNLIAKGYNIQDIKGLDECTWPCILHWNFDHFVVFEGRKGEYFYINDPAFGRRRVGKEEFNQSFTGIALILTPNESFQKKNQKNSLSIFFSYALRGSFFALATAIGFGVLQILPSLVIAGASKGFIDYVFLKSMYHWASPLAVVIVSAVIFQMILILIQQRLLMRLHMHLKLNLESRIIHRLFYLPLPFFDQRLSGDILYRFSSIQILTDHLSIGVMGAFINLISLSIFCVILYAISPSLFGILCAFIAIRIALFLYYKKNIRERNVTYIQDAGRLSGIEMNGLQSMEMLKANHLETVFFKNWAANHDESINKSKDAMVTEQQYSFFLSLFTGILPIALLFKGTLFVMDGSMSVGTLIAFITLSKGFDGPIMTLLEFSASLEKIKVSISRIHDILFYGDHKAKLDAETAPQPALPECEISNNLPHLQNEIIFEQITFGYSPLDPPLFENLSLIIPKGKTTAIVGASGSGKSTLSKLLCGLYTPQKGQILWDGSPISSIPSEARSKLMTLVDQDIFFFEGTVRDNISSWNQTVSDEVLTNALKQAELYDDLVSRGLLDAPIAENGTNLSGGQRQRLEIARAFAVNPDVYILDEATSALDTIAEKKIFETFNQSKATLLIIAHRLSTIQNADLIYVLENGKLVQWGNHQDLLGEKGLYQTLFEQEALA